MSVQHLNEVQTLARAAANVGATLPTEITQGLEHLEEIRANAQTKPSPGLMARDLAIHLGYPATMDKARKAAVQHLVTAEATAQLDAHLLTVCGTRLRSTMRAQGEAIGAAFGAALADDLTTLRNDAARLPLFFRDHQADTLTPETFVAWTRVRDAYARICSTHLALAPLYAGAVNEHGAQFPTDAANSLRFANPKRVKTSADAYAFRDALAGRALTGQGVAAQGSARVDGLFVPTQLAHVGASFEWATPKVVTARAAAAVKTMTADVVAA